MNLHNSVSQTPTAAKRALAVISLVCLGALGAVWLYRSLQQSRQDDQSTAYQAPQIAQPIPISEEPVPSQQSILQASTDNHPLDAVLRLAQEIRNHIERDVRDYTATLVKRERINGKLGSQEYMDIKVRNPRNEGDTRVPLSAYIKFIPPSPNAGREVIWVEGRNAGKLQAYQLGIPISLEPTGTLAMMGNKYPITEIGLLKLTERLIEKGNRDRQLGNCKVDIFADQIVAGRTCKMIQVMHDDRLAQFDFHIAQIYIDDELQIPVRYVAYLWPEAPGKLPLLEEEYTYSNLRLNVDLRDLDFDPTNPDYGFP